MHSCQLLQKLHTLVFRPQATHAILKVAPSVFVCGPGSPNNLFFFVHHVSSQVRKGTFCNQNTQHCQKYSLACLYIQASHHLPHQTRLCTGAHSCWNRKRPFPNCSHKVGSIKLFNISWYAKTLKVSFPGSKRSSPPEKQHIIIPAPPNRQVPFSWQPPNPDSSITLTFPVASTLL